MSYNGWTNYETWNVTLWVGNDEALYNLARECKTYASFIAAMKRKGITKTPDNVRYNDPKLDLQEIEDFFKEIA